MLVSYQRTGGAKPRSAEMLEIADDGGWSLRRVVGGPRVGQFGGELEGKALAKLSRQAKAVSGTEVIQETGGRPPFETEEVITADGTLTFRRHQKLPSKVASLADALRSLADDLTESPVAALELDIAPDAASMTVTAIGAKPVGIEFSSGELPYDLFGAEEELLSSASVALSFAGTGPQELPPGWSESIPLPSDLEFNPKRTLQVRFTFRMKFDDGVWRDSQITAVAGQGWS